MQETKRRGRPARDENDTQSNLCTIKDPNMEPFYIVKDATNFTVMELSTSMRGFAGKKATGKDLESGTLYLSYQGLMKLEFKSEDTTSKYYMVRKEESAF